VTGVANLGYAGNNTLRLNNSTNTSVTSYNFDSIATTGNPTNYQGLALVNAGSRWQSATLTIGSGGTMLASNTTATVAAAFASTGSVTVVNSTITFSSNAVVSGAYVSDPSTNIFNADLTITATGYIAGSVGDLFDFKKSFIINSTNSNLFNLALSTVSFSGANAFHTNAVAGSDYGPGQAPGDKPFSYYDLVLSNTTDQIYFTSGAAPVTSSNALYTWLVDLPNHDTNYVANLHSPFNIYYVTSNAAPQNAYLMDKTYPLAGGGFLLVAVPEPSALLLVLLGALPLLYRRR
jgi:hypothetical protein